MATPATHHGPHNGPTIGVYVAVFAALLALTATTVAVAFVDLGVANNVVMLGIAVTKATLVVLFFMHVAYGPRLVWVLAASGFAWLALLVSLTLADVMTRAVAG
jgi:cytochrome c oxidase subunit 4